MFLDFTERELRVIALRTHGIRAAEIARLDAVTSRAIYSVLREIYRKAGVNDVASLTRWAIENALDEPIPDTPENAAVPVPKVMSGVNYLSEPTTTILPDQRQLLSMQTAANLLDWC